MGKARDGENVDKKGGKFLFFKKMVCPHKKPKAGEGEVVEARSYEGGLCVQGRVWR